MKAMIHSYRNRPGEHCASTALRNLLCHYCDLDLPEAVVFGLGSGLDFLLLENETFRPALMLFGRSPTLEPDVAAALAVDYCEQAEKDNDRAWAIVRDEVAEGRPTMLSGDAFYLTYRDFKVHFPAHRFVLVGFDDETQTAYVADRLDTEPQPCAYEALRLSRNPPAFLSTYNLWGKFHDTRVARTLPEAYEIALALNAQRMLEGEEGLSLPGLRASRGLAGLRRFVEQLPTWFEREDCDDLTSYAASCIEKFGTGGGNFRTLYAGFLREARATVPHLVDEEAPELAARSSAKWSELAGSLREAARDRRGADTMRYQRLLDEILALETRLFERLAAPRGPR
jgi:hypothetical protein